MTAVVPVGSRKPLVGHSVSSKLFVDQVDSPILVVGWMVDRIPLVDLVERRMCLVGSVAVLSPHLFVVPDH